MTKHKLFVILVNYNSGTKMVKLKTKLSQMPLVSRVIEIDNSPPHPNLGFAGGVNAGVEQALKAGATDVLLLNPDINLSQKNISSLLATDLDIVSPVLKFRRSGQLVKDYGGKVNWLLGRTTHYENSQGLLDYVSGACMLIARGVFEKIGLFDSKYFMYFEDVDFCLRAKQARFTVGVDAQNIVDHRLIEHKLSGNKAKLSYLLDSNKRFIDTWVHWLFKPLAYLYLATLWYRSNKT